MKIKTLYTKIFLSFLLFLFITEIAIFGFVVLFAGRKYRDHFDKLNSSRIQLTQQLIEQNLKKTSEIPLVDNSSLRELVLDLAIVFKARIWLTSADKSIVYKSFEGDLPTYLIEKYEDHETNPDSILSRHQNHVRSYLTKTIRVNSKDTATLHILFREPPSMEDMIGFAVGLAGIGVIIALMIIPASRQISRPIKDLTYSARKLEAGQLSHRAAIKSKDEIGELGNAFNLMADKLEKMMISSKELTAQISHELRSPLARIQIAVELIKDRLTGNEKTELTEHFFEIEEDIGELDHLIGRILELSKLDFAQHVSYSESFSPAVLLKSLLKKFEPMIESKKINFSKDLTSEATISGNREAFNTALSNLVDNAGKFSPENGSIHVSSSSEKNRLLITIINTCPNLSKEDLERIFDPFYRIDPREKSYGGLGLAITKKIIEKHKGTITAHNTPSGLEMRLSIPTL
ncbi:HAMP domain-containing histidine kinase [bacterium]|nr:HAMP domain-containing histidine kinase [bacterium]